jgi:hypothetical protein
MRERRMIITTWLDLTKRFKSKINLTARINNLIQSEKKNREETQEGILEMIKIMNDRMKNDLLSERKERETNEEVLIELLENTCNRLQQSTAKI